MEGESPAKRPRPSPSENMARPPIRQTQMTNSELERHQRWQTSKPAEKKAKKRKLPKTTGDNNYGFRPTTKDVCSPSDADDQNVNGENEGPPSLNYCVGWPLVITSATCWQREQRISRSGIGAD